jgi:signal transduction histidine kinase
MDSSAHHQLSRLHALTDRLASADPSSSPLLILSALGTALGADQLTLHVGAPDGGLRLLCALGLPADLQESWEQLPSGPGGGPMGLASTRSEAVVDPDVRIGSAWRQWRDRLWRLRIASSWAVPFHGSEGLGGVITVFRDRIGSPTRSELDLAVLYGGYAANALERDRLVGELTSRNLVLETIRDVLETLSAPVPITAALRQALETLVQGVRADAAAVFTGDPAASDPGTGDLTCLALAVGTDRVVDRADLAELVRTHQPAADDGTAGFRVGDEGWGRVVALPGPDGTDWLVVVRDAGGVTAETAALVEDAAHSLRLALERDRAQQAAQETAALRRSRELQRDFLARLSHELRTPLTAIGGYADSLLQQDVVWDADSQERFLARIADESRRLGRLVEDLLDHSAIESGVLRLQRDWCDLALVVDAARACIPQEARDRVDVAVPRDLPPIWADHDRLEQVFVNLLDNAIRHNPPQTRVRVSLLPGAAGEVGVVVRDDGTGDARAIAAGTPRERRGRRAGAGLGLSIARAIVAAHGGSITVEPAEPGVRFVLRLPAEPDDEHELDPETAVHPAAEEATGA